MKKTGKRLAALALSASMALTAAGAAFAAETQNTDFVKPFTDVSQRAWYSPFVAYVYEQNLFAGTSATTFAPQHQITRADLVTVIGKMHTRITFKNPLNEGEMPQFTDVASDQYYTYYVGWAQKHHIVSGYGDGKFHPNDPITREMAATIIDQYVDYLGTELEGEKQSSNDYKDWDQVAGWAKDSVKALTDHGIMTGDDKLCFGPKRSISRAEAATVITRVYQDVKYHTETDAKYQSIRYSKEFDDNKPSTMLVGSDSYQVISNYEDYIALANKVKADEQPALGETPSFTPVEESYFENGDILAVELQHKGGPQYQTKLSNYTFNITTAPVTKWVDLTFFGQHAGGATANTVGYVFFIEVPKGVDSVTFQEAYRVEGFVDTIY